MATNIEQVNFDQLKAIYHAVATEQRPFDNFSEAVDHLDWEQREAAEFLDVMKMAFSLGAVKLAREIGERGLEKYPDDSSLIKFARIIAPGIARTHPHEGLPSNSIAPLAWFKTQAARYRGQWVAVEKDTLVGAAASLDELMKTVGALITDNTVVTRIP